MSMGNLGFLSNNNVYGEKPVASLLCNYRQIPCYSRGLSISIFVCQRDNGALTIGPG